MNVDEHLQTFAAKCYFPIIVLNHCFSLIQVKRFPLIRTLSQIFDNSVVEPVGLGLWEIPTGFLLGLRLGITVIPR